MFSGAPRIEPEVSRHSTIGPRSSGCVSGAAAAAAAADGSGRQSTTTASVSCASSRPSAWRARHSFFNSRWCSPSSSLGSRCSSRESKRMPVISPGAPGSLVVSARSGSRCVGAAGRDAACGGRCTLHSRLPSRCSSATSSGSVARRSAARRAASHSRERSWPRIWSQRRCAPSASWRSSARSSSRPAVSTVQAARNSCVTCTTACARVSAGCRSTMRSRCHSSVRSTCSASAGTPRASAGRPSSPTTRRSGAQAAASPKSAAASGSAPAFSRASQCAASSRRLSRPPIAATSVGSQTVRGSRASRS